MTSPGLPSSVVGELRAALGDAVLVPGDAEYVLKRPVWNARDEASPAAVVMCRDEAAVATAVTVLAPHDVDVAVRGGGHSVAGHGTSDGGVVVALEGLRDVSVDPERRVAVVGGGATWGPVDAATAAHGLATVGGQISTTGVGGLTLGGGVGWLMRKHGLTVDNLRSVAVVDAEGQRRLASERDDPDLFWAVRGGGGNFGIVVQFEFDLHPVTDVLGGTLLFALEDAPQLMETFRVVAADAPRELTMMVLMLAAPRQPVIPTEFHGRPVALFALCHAGDHDEGAEVIAPFRALGPIVDSIRVLPYVELQSLFDDGSRPGYCNAWRSPFLHSVDAGLVEVVAEHAERMPTAGSQVLLCNMGGAVADVPVDATAFGHRDAPFYIEMIAKWEPGEDGVEAVDWADAFATAVEPWSTGHTYVNFLDSGHRSGTRAAYRDATYRRLADLKRRYDPENLFRSNHNIEPT